LLVHFLNPPNWFTAASILCSTMALGILLEGQAAGGLTAELLVRACILIVVGGVFDNLDGRVARLTRRETEFGIQLDSIADVLGFGFSPALIAWAWQLHRFGKFGLAITFLYVACAAFRLARFNVNTVVRTWPFAGHSQGLTSTMAGGILVSFVWLGNEGWLHHFGLPEAAVPAVTTALVGSLGYLMVSSIPYRNFKDVKQSRVARRYMALAVTLTLGAAWWYREAVMFFGVAGALYFIGGTLDGLITAAKAGALNAALLVGNDPSSDDDAHPSRP
jgi:CDP-diacylglycerol--serine O-phosphatidyltransferase